MTKQEYIEEYGEYIEDLVDEWSHNTEEYCSICGSRLLLTNEVYPIGDTHFTRTEFVCPMCD